jgi:hypothetical protein
MAAFSFYATAACGSSSDTSPAQTIDSQSVNAQPSGRRFDVVHL